MSDLLPLPPPTIRSTFQRDLARVARNQFVYNDEADDDLDALLRSIPTEYVTNARLQTCPECGGNMTGSECKKCGYEEDEDEDDYDDSDDYDENDADVHSFDGGASGGGGYVDPPQYTDPPPVMNPEEFKAFAYSDDRLRRDNQQRQGLNHPLTLQPPDTLGGVIQANAAERQANANRQAKLSGQLTFNGGRRHLVENASQADVLGNRPDLEML